MTRARPIAKRRARRTEAAAAFRVFCLAMAVLAVVGMLRVTLAVQAQEAAIDANDLRRVIQTEEQVSKVLEADRSALAAPSRIESIASAALNMAQPAEVCYISLPVAEQPSAVEAKPSATNTGRGVSQVAGIISSVMDVAVGEAQVLLVGDVGIAPAK
jgi:cell division protein FtsL